MDLSKLTLSSLSPRLPVPDSRPCPRPSLQSLFQSCDPALVNISVEEPGACCKLDSELLSSCCCHRREIRGREKAERSNRKSVIWTHLSSTLCVTGRSLSGLQGGCSSTAVLWAVIWHLQRCSPSFHHTHSTGTRLHLTPRLLFQFSNTKFSC